MTTSFLLLKNFLAAFPTKSFQSRESSLSLFNPFPKKMAVLRLCAIFSCV